MGLIRFRYYFIGMVFLRRVLTNIFIVLAVYSIKVIEDKL